VGPPECKLSAAAMATSSQAFAESEVDRYSSTPAQALGYLLGYYKLD
jgi:uncharacterized protein (DUF885 family)